MEFPGPQGHLPEIELRCMFVCMYTYVIMHRSRAVMYICMYVYYIHTYIHTYIIICLCVLDSNILSLRSLGLRIDRNICEDLLTLTVGTFDGRAMVALYHYSGSCRCAIIGVPWCLRRLSLFSTFLHMFLTNRSPQAKHAATISSLDRLSL